MTERAADAAGGARKGRGRGEGGRGRWAWYLLHFVVCEAEHVAHQLQHLGAFVGRSVEVAEQKVLQKRSEPVNRRSVKHASLHDSACTASTIVNVPEVATAATALQVRRLIRSNIMRVALSE